jgi:hypothetical protein
MAKPWKAATGFAFIALLSGQSNVHQLTLPTGRGPGSIAIADVNHDGRSDILILNTIDGTLTVLLNDGHRSFHPWATVPTPAGRNPNDLAVADFNHDGNPDVVIANTETPNLTILLGDGTGSFKPSSGSPFATTSFPHVHGVAAADFNSDGKIDVATDSWGHDQILLFNGDGAGNLILPGKLFSTGKRPYERLRTADFNGDGQPDIVTTDMDINAVSILLGDGKGGFTNAPGSPSPAGPAPWAVAVDDINKDGHPDLIVIPYEPDVKDGTQPGVTILLGDGKGAFSKTASSPLSLAGCRGPDRVAAGDVNGDGFRDIVVSCAQNDKIVIYLGSKNGAYQRQERGVPTGWSGLAVGDLDGDGKDDIVVSSNPDKPTPGPGNITIFFGQ